MAQITEQDRKMRQRCGQRWRVECGRDMRELCEGEPGGVPASPVMHGYSSHPDPALAASEYAEWEPSVVIDLFTGAEVAV